MRAKFVGRADGDSAVAVAPKDERGGGELFEQEPPEIGHVLMPGTDEFEQMRHGARGAKVFAVGVQALGGVPALRAGHAAQGDHLQPFWIPRHGVGEEAARQRLIEVDERLGFVEVRVSGRKQRQRRDEIRMRGGEAQGDGASMRVTDDDWRFQAESYDGLGYEFRCGGEVGGKILVAFGKAGSGQVKGDHMLAEVEFLHQGQVCRGATHESVQKNNRGASLHCRTFFEVGETKAIEMKVTPNGHSESLFRIEIWRV